MLTLALERAAAGLPPWLTWTIGMAGSTVAIALLLIRGYATFDSANRVCRIRVGLHKLMPHARRVSYADVACLRLRPIKGRYGDTGASELLLELQDGTLISLGGEDTGLANLNLIARTVADRLGCKIIWGDN
ncbi:MAG TPA: hypothetical protein DEP35_13420 [Deltaproteobacteria bacterium]|nr:hypothetical protein [Deltaproteobacteria bacterium]